LEDNIPDKNLFMMCPQFEHDAARELPMGFHVRYCKPSELDTWKAMHFDTPEEAAEYHAFMTQYFNDMYFPKGDLFYHTCLFVCDQDDRPIGTGFLWKAYDMIWTLHWLKVLKEYEGKGIGRALLSVVMKSISEKEYPVFLHTHPSSYRAIKLYSDVGFRLLSDPFIGNRQNDLDECLPILQKYMPQQDFEQLKVDQAPQFFLDAVGRSDIDEF